jgi:hypothetical protein
LEIYCLFDTFDRKDTVLIWIMNLRTIKHSDYLKKIPEKGRHILAQQSEDKILLYQAFRNETADFALANQFFGGPAYSYLRMSWIKPNFLWMMHRCGWAEKPGQERVLGIWIEKTDFDLILKESVFSSYQANIYKTAENWKRELSEKEVRLQWDPDHDIYGAKQERKAIQLGLKGKMLEKFGKDMAVEIIDFTEFVREQKKIIDAENLEQLLIPDEQIYKPDDEKNKFQIGLIK